MSCEGQRSLTWRVYGWHFAVCMAWPLQHCAVPTNHSTVTQYVIQMLHTFRWDSSCMLSSPDPFPQCEEVGWLMRLWQQVIGPPYEYLDPPLASHGYSSFTILTVLTWQRWCPHRLLRGSCPATSCLYTVWRIWLRPWEEALLLRQNYKTAGKHLPMSASYGPLLQNSSRQPVCLRDRPHPSTYSIMWPSTCSCFAYSLGAMHCIRQS